MKTKKAGLLPPFLMKPVGSSSNGLKKKLFPYLLIITFFTAEPAAVFTSTKYIPFG